MRGFSRRGGLCVAHTPRVHRIARRDFCNRHCNPVVELTPTSSDFNKLWVGNRWHGAGIAHGMSALVLIVDDSSDARALYREYLEFCGFRVETAADGEEGLAKAHAEWPAVILMDLAMPGMDGWEAIRRLRADPKMGETPIVALSTSAFGDEPDRAREAGADLCLTKPCLPSQVGRVVRAMLWRRELVRSTA
jgi:CheY-like chemotaxis protein